MSARNAGLLLLAALPLWGCPSDSGKDPGHPSEAAGEETKSKKPWVSHAHKKFARLDLTRVGTSAGKRLPGVVTAALNPGAELASYEVSRSVDGDVLVARIAVVWSGSALADATVESRGSEAGHQSTTVLEPGEVSSKAQAELDRRMREFWDWFGQQIGRHHKGGNKGRRRMWAFRAESVFNKGKLGRRGEGIQNRIFAGRLGEVLTPLLGGKGASHYGTEIVATAGNDNSLTLTVSTSWTMDGEQTATILSAKANSDESLGVKIVQPIADAPSPAELEAALAPFWLELRKAVDEARSKKAKRNPL